jgi:iduronate 2-sulfatase
VRSIPPFQRGVTQNRGSFDKRFGRFCMEVPPCLGQGFAMLTRGSTRIPPQRVKNSIMNPFPDYEATNSSVLAMPFAARVFRVIARRAAFNLAILCFALSGVLSVRTAAADQKFNVLFIVSDDLNTSLACYGNPVVKTPNLDRLAARGVRFDRAYVQVALCNPSRVSFLSGLRPHRTGVHDLKTFTRANLPEHVFLPQHFRKSGYYAAMVGKVYHTGDGFEDPASWDLEIRESGKSPRPEDVIAGFDAKGLPWRTDHSWAWNKLNIPDAQTPDGVVARKAVEIIEGNRPADKPFFLAVGFRRPHSPYSAPAAYFDLYPPEKMRLPEEPAEHLKSIPLAALTYDPDKPRVPPERAREVIGAYYACVSFVDAQVGLIMDALERKQLWDKTVIVFIGDHGYHLGEHGNMWHKQSNFEEAARAPMIIVAPGRKPNAVCPRTVEFVDLYPTLADVAGVRVPNIGLQGVSLVPLLTDPQRPWDRPAFTEIQRVGFTGRSVRTERWRYIEWDDGRKGAQLYDHDRDPKEYVNLAQDPAAAETVKRMKALLRQSVGVAISQR